MGEVPHVRRERPLYDANVRIVQGYRVPAPDGCQVAVQGFDRTVEASGFWVWGFVSRDPGSGFRISGFGIRVSCFESRDSGFGIRGFGVRDLGIWDAGFGIRGSGFGTRDSGFGILLLLYYSQA